MDEDAISHNFAVMPSFFALPTMKSTFMIAHGRTDIIDFQPEFKDAVTTSCKLNEQGSKYHFAGAGKMIGMIHRTVLEKQTLNGVIRGFAGAGKTARGY